MIARPAAMRQPGSEEGKTVVSRRLPASYHLLRPMGAVLLGIAYLIASDLIRIGPAYAGHEPLSVYALSVVLFLSASAGAAMLVHGHHLFDRVIVSKRWIAQAPPSLLREGAISDSGDAPGHDPVG
jgi:hypothetical protein